MSRRHDLRVKDVAGLVAPTKSTTPEAVSERKRQALHGFAQGKKKGQIATDLGIHRNTIANWLREDDIFREQVERIMADRDAELAEEMEELSLGLARGETSKDNIPQWPVIKHWLQVTDAKRHGDKKQIEHTGTVIHSMIPRARRLTDMLNDPDIIDVPVTEEDE